MTKSISGDASKRKVRLASVKTLSTPVTADTATAKPAASDVPAAPTLGLSVLPTHPGFTDFTTEAWFAPVLNAVRAMAAVQAKVLDHACAELQASLSEAEALARAASPSEAVIMQGKAISRRFKANSAYVSELAETARTAAKAA